MKQYTFRNSAFNTRPLKSELLRHPLSERMRFELSYSKRNSMKAGEYIGILGNFYGHLLLPDGLGVSWYLIIRGRYAS